MRELGRKREREDKFRINEWSRRGGGTNTFIPLSRPPSGKKNNVDGDDDEKKVNESN